MYSTSVKYFPVVLETFWWRPVHAETFEVLFIYFTFKLVATDGNTIQLNINTIMFL
jgi:hypothetical protein